MYTIPRVYKKNMDIVACTDSRNMMPTGVMICSVCENNRNVDIVFHIITDEDVTIKNWQELENVVAPYNKKIVVFHPITEDVLNNHFPGVDKRIPRASYFRLFLTKLLPHDLDKVLYLDGDIIVRHSLTELWNVDVSAYALAAVPDMREGTIDRYNRLQYSPSLGYFNAGMLLINLKYWREHQVVDQFLDCMRKHQVQLVYHDQDILNFVFHEQKKMLPIKYNFQHGHLWKEPLFDFRRYEQQVAEARKDPVIIHYTGGKPWMSYIKYPNPYGSSFFKYQDMTNWKGIKVDNRSLKTRIRACIGDMLRWMNLRPQLRNDYIEIAPID